MGIILFDKMSDWNSRRRIDKEGYKKAEAEEKKSSEIHESACRKSEGIWRKNLVAAALNRLTENFESCVKENLDRVWPTKKYIPEFNECLVRNLENAKHQIQYLYEEI